jgi:hypothetical protein
MCKKRTVHALVAALLAGLAAPAARAESWLSLRSDTLLGAGGARPAFGAADTRSQVPIYELLEARVVDLGVAGLELELAGFAGVHVGHAPLEAPGVDGPRALGNVSVGLLRWHDARRRLGITVGRQYLFAGGGRAEHLDGLSLEVRLPWQLELTVFGGRTSAWQLDYEPDGGSPSPEAEGFAFSNYAAGGRVRLRVLERGVAAVSFVHEGHGAETVRRLLSVDGGYWSSRYLEALAGATLDAVVWRPQELWVQLVSRPRERLKLTLDWSYQVPGLAIPKTSIFSVFAEGSLQELAAGVHFAPGAALSLGLEGGVRLLPGDDGLRSGWSAALSARLALGEGAGRLAGLRAEVLDADGERLVSSRLYALYSFAFGLHASAEAYLLYAMAAREGAAASIFERRVAEQPLSYGGLALVGYRILPLLSLQIAGSAFSTPSARYDLRLISRLSVEAEWGGGR